MDWFSAQLLSNIIGAQLLIMVVVVVVITMLKTVFAIFGETDIFLCWIEKLFII